MGEIKRTKLNSWMNKYKPKDTMVFRYDFWDTYMFWDNYLIPIFVDFEKFPGLDSWNELCECINSYTEIVGEHMSKSIVHPVIKIEYNGVKIVFRYNFYDYNVSVIGDIPFIFPPKLLENSKFMCEGFPDEYQVKTPYSIDNNRTFIAVVQDHYKFYTFLFLLKNQIDTYIGGNND